MEQLRLHPYKAVRRLIGRGSVISGGAGFGVTSADQQPNVIPSWSSSFSWVFTHLESMENLQTRRKRACWPWTSGGVKSNHRNFGLDQNWQLSFLQGWTSMSHLAPAERVYFGVLILEGNSRSLPKQHNLKILMVEVQDTVRAQAAMR